MLEDTAVSLVEEGMLHTADSQRIKFDECLWCTQACAPDWLEKCNLPLGEILNSFVSMCILAASQN